MDFWMEVLLSYLGANGWRFTLYTSFLTSEMGTLVLLTGFFVFNLLHCADLCQVLYQMLTNLCWGKIEGKSRRGGRG